MKHKSLAIVWLREREKVRLVVSVYNLRIFCVYLLKLRMYYIQWSLTLVHFTLLSKHD